MPLVVPLEQGNASRRFEKREICSRGGEFTVFFNPDPVTDFDGAAACDTERFARFFRGLLERGVYLPCSQFEATFASTAHTEDQLDEAIAAAEDVLHEMKD